MLQLDARSSFFINNIRKTNNYSALLINLGKIIPLHSRLHKLPKKSGCSIHGPIISVTTETEVILVQSSGLVPAVHHGCCNNIRCGRV
jgi:hypothetical protein